MVKLEGFESRRHQDNAGGVKLDFKSRSNLPDPDPIFTKEWIESILAVNKNLGPQEAHRLLLETVQAAIDAGVDIDVVNTPYTNTIAVEKAIRAVSFACCSNGRVSMCAHNHGCARCDDD